MFQNCLPRNPSVSQTLLLLHRTKRILGALGWDVKDFLVRRNKPGFSAVPIKKTAK